MQNFFLANSHAFCARNYFYLSARRDNKLIEQISFFSRIFIWVDVQIFFISLHKSSSTLRTTDFVSRPMSSEYFVLLIIETAKMKEQPPISQGSSFMHHRNEFSLETFWSRCALHRVSCRATVEILWFRAVTKERGLRRGFSCHKTFNIQWKLTLSKKIRRFSK